MSAPHTLRHAAGIPAGVLAGSLSESEASRRVYLAAGGLGLLGLLLLVGTVWWWRSTRNEHPSLAPLEVMGARRWRRASEPERQRLVEGVRPEGASVGAPVVEPEPVDLAALAVGDHAGFDDLREIDELLGLDVEQLLALKPQLVPGADAAPDQDDDADAGVDADAGADADDDETVAIAPDGAAAAAELVVGAPHDDEPDAADDDVLEVDEVDEVDVDELDEAALAPGDPLLERSTND